MLYTSTRDTTKAVSFTEAMLHGLAPDGGLFMPRSFPAYPSASEICSLGTQTYPAVARHVFGSMVGDLFATAPDDVPCPLTSSINKAYSSFTQPEVVTPLHRFADGQYALEAFHGPTLSFKDIAMQLLGNWMSEVLGRKGLKAIVLGATSGDTGSAAVNAFANCDGIDLVILHPLGRVSPAQRRQMTSCNAANVHNIAIEGTFDNCQALVKQLYAAPEIRRNKHVTGINSINFARILAQQVYYVAASCQNFAVTGRATDFVVPSGNFGNALAGLMAKRSGWPIGRIAIATNDNDILYRAWNRGNLEAAQVIPTISPAMDIQVASNFERFVFLSSDRNANATKTTMEVFSKSGSIDLPKSVHDQFRALCFAGSANQTDTINAIKDAYEKYGMIIDPHTAVGYHVMQQMNQTQPSDNNRVLISTAHPAKFGDVVTEALGFESAMPERLSRMLDKPEHYSTLPANYSTVLAHICKSVSGVT